MAADAYYDNVLNLFAQGFLESRQGSVCILATKDFLFGTAR